MEAKNLSFSYSDNPFMKGLDVRLEEGKVTTIIGPNGSGKSTLLNLFANQFKPHGGEIFFEAKRLKEIKQKELARKLAVVYQHNSAPSDLTVERLIYYGRVPHKKFWEVDNKQDKEIVDWAIEVTNIEALRDKSLASLSGGERQRAWIAMALAQKPKILFLDEPTTYLDIYYQLEILHLVRELNHEHHLTVVMVLHDINQAMQFSDQVIVMKKGSILYDGAVDQVFTEEMIEEVYGIQTVIRWCDVNQCHYIMPARLKGKACNCEQPCYMMKQSIS